MEVSVNNKSKAKIKEEDIVALVKFFAKKYSPDSQELSLAIIGDKVMRRLNKEYRKIDSPTDILSFDGEGDFLGELIIDLSQIKRQKPYFSRDINKELLFIITHGLLHLIGYDDQKEEERDVMIKKGKKILEKFLQN